VLVTGASAGIGRACADRLAAAAGWGIAGAGARGSLGVG
jgi:NAD(P)-dependent dehydrogenase (short-subunit alcohol dehydrogenase family)